MVASRPTFGPAERIDDTTDLLMEASEPDRPEADIPEPVIDFLEADLEFGDRRRRPLSHWSGSQDLAPSILPGTAGLGSPI